MIDVPVQVKDVLREGNTLKNYRFEVLKEAEKRDTITVLETLTAENTSYVIPSNGNYILYNEEDYHAFEYVEVIGAAAQSEVCPVGITETWMVLNFLSAGDILTIYGLHANDVKITRTDLVTYTTEWVTDFAIGNNNLVSESVNIDDRMCSGDTLKYGLCEGVSVEFQYFGLNNITGRKLKAFVDVEYRKARDIGPRDYHTIQTIKYRGVLEVPIWQHNVYGVTLSDGTPRGTLQLIASDGTVKYTIRTLIDSTDVTYVVQPIDNTQAGDTIKFTPDDLTINYTMYLKMADIYHAITLGYFDVKSSSRQASTGIIKVTAYNKLQSDYLNTKANNRIADMFPGMTYMPIYDIKRYLLGSYQIYEDESAIAGIDKPEPTGDLPIEESYFTNTGSLKFRSLYGIKSPINAYRYGISDLNESFSIDIVSQHLRVEYTGDVNMRFGAYTGTIEGLEHNFVEFLKDLINSANLDKTWEDVLAYICTHDGFQKIFSIDNYSTVQWEYEEAHNLTHTVPGPISYTQTIGRTYATLNIPENIDLWGIDLIGNAYSRGDNHWHDYYEYYADRNLTLATEPCPYLTFSDGSRFFNELEDPEYPGQYFLPITAFDYSALPKTDQAQINLLADPDFTLRDLIAGVYESVCQFGKLNRETDLFSGVELNNSRLYPADTLYPDAALYPAGAQESGFRSQYSKLWADEGNVHRWKYLIITYKARDGEGNEVEKRLQRTVNANGTDNYNMSDNWIFRNLVWTAEQVGECADAMVEKMRDITWFPFEMWCAGLPYLETGDEIEIPLGEETYTSYILQRQLKGIQNLQDTYINGTLDIF